MTQQNSNNYQSPGINLFKNRSFRKPKIDGDGVIGFLVVRIVAQHATYSPDSRPVNTSTIDDEKRNYFFAPLFWYCFF